MFAVVQATRREWEAITETTRRIALAADTELRRRHPDMRIEPLRPHPSEAAGIVAAVRNDRPVPDDTRVQETFDSRSAFAEHNAPAKSHDELTARKQREADAQLALGLTTETASDQIPTQVLRIRENARIAQAKLDELARTPLPGDAEHDLSPGPAWPAFVGPDRDAVLQPPKPDVVPSARVLGQHAEPAGAEHPEPEQG